MDEVLGLSQRRLGSSRRIVQEGVVVREYATVGCPMKIQDCLLRDNVDFPYCDGAKVQDGYQLMPYRGGLPLWVVSDLRGLFFGLCGDGVVVASLEKRAE